MKPVLVVANPSSASGRTGRRWPAIAGALRAAGLDFDVALTAHPEHAAALARAGIREGRELLVAAGGDGTINEVVNGFFEAGERLPGDTRLGVLPMGTGGDFRRTFAIPIDPAAAARVLIDGRPRRIDAGRVHFRSHSGRDEVRFFINIADAGLGGDVVDRVNRGPKLGPMTFTLASLLALIRYRNKPMTVIVDGSRTELLAQQVVIANCEYFGGGMRFAPGASPDDGRLDVITVGDASRIETVRGLSAVRAGTHLETGNPKWSRLLGSRIEVTSTEPVRIDVDGEQPGLLPALFEVVPGAIELMTPR